MCFNHNDLDSQGKAQDSNNRNECDLMRTTIWISQKKQNKKLLNAITQHKILTQNKLREPQLI